MGLYTGFDLHANNSYVGIINADGDHIFLLAYRAACHGNPISLYPPHFTRAKPLRRLLKSGYWSMRMTYFLEKFSVHPLEQIIEKSVLLP